MIVKRKDIRLEDFDKISIINRHACTTYVDYIRKDNSSWGKVEVDLGKDVSKSVVDIKFVNAMLNFYKSLKGRRWIKYGRCLEIHSK